MASHVARKVDARGRGPAEIVGELRRPGGFLSQSVRDAVRRIVDEVRERGDSALLEYTERFDGVRLQEIRVPQGEIDKAREALSPELEESFGVAIEKVRSFHERDGPLVGADLRRGHDGPARKAHPPRRALHPGRTRLVPEHARHVGGAGPGSRGAGDRDLHPTGAGWTA